ncbi:MAG: endonuclease/exonuclease/phosphatase family protein [Oculatellaceae cyanobacterium bins.114]|nr:endonuclease/exonuclease/phosphatase family protein [Oculatellaceae cyanobacterium bins.114]
MLARLLLLYCGWFYILITLLWLILRAIVFDRIWWVAIANSYILYFLALLPLLLIAAVWGRCWRLLLGLSVPVLAFLGLYGALFVPAIANLASGNGSAVTVMTFNVLLGNVDAAPLMTVIREHHPDILGLQELTPELADALIPQLIKDYPYTTVELPLQSKSEVVGVVSRFPIQAKTTFPLGGVRYGINVNTQEEFILPGPRLGTRATVLIDQQPVEVAVVDLMHNPLFSTPLNQWGAAASEYYRQKKFEIDRLKQELQQENHPFLLLCDCNFQDTSESYAQLSRVAQDSFYEKGWGLGRTAVFNLGLPTQRLDYIWYSKEFRPLEAIAGQDRSSSDHFPVIAKLQLR